MRKATAYSLVLLTVLMPVMHKFYSGIQETIHPYPLHDMDIRPDWYIALFSYNARPLVFLLVWKVYPKLFKSVVLKWLIAYEIVLIADYLLAYTQTPGRILFGGAFSILIVFYYLHKEK